MKSVRLAAYAKVNLYLDVLGKRPDGYHELLTLFQRIDLCDQVMLEALPGTQIEVHCSHPEVPRDGTNLVARAAQSYRQALGETFGVRITLEKRIPVAAGLGGGSSNAAATLLGLQELRGNPLSQKQLLTLAKGLGADVPFFLGNTPWAVGRGRGDEIEPLDIKTHLLNLLVYPGFSVPTKSVYQAFTLPTGRPGLTGSGPDVTLLTRALRDNRVSRIRDLLYNALEPTVEVLYPALRDVKATIQTTGGLKHPLVSGSGSTILALCVCREEAQAAAQALREQAPAWQVCVAGTRE